MLASGENMEIVVDEAIHYFPLRNELLFFFDNSERVQLRSPISRRINIRLSHGMGLRDGTRGD